MAFSGNCGLDVSAECDDPLSFLFSEELGLAVEYLPKDERTIASLLGKARVPFQILGRTTAASYNFV